MLFLRENRFSFIMICLFCMVFHSMAPYCMAGGDIYYHSDLAGNIVALSDDDANIVAQYVYDPFGQVLSQTGTVENSYKFGGAFGITEEVGDLYFMRARYYSADACRFLSTDPVKNIGPGWQPNRYGYAANNPYSFVDPDGEMFVSVIFVSKPAISPANYIKGLVQKFLKGYGKYKEIFPLDVQDLPNYKVHQDAEFQANLISYTGYAISDNTANQSQSHTPQYGNRIDIGQVEGFSDNLTPASVADRHIAKSEPVSTGSKQSGSASRSSSGGSSKSMSSGAVNAANHASDVSAQNQNNKSKSVAQTAKNVGNAIVSSVKNTAKAYVKTAKKVFNKVKSWFKR